MILDKLWKLDDKKLTNKANLWVSSDGSWKFEEKWGGLICIKNTLENKVLEPTEDGVILNVYNYYYKDEQLWIKGEENNEGYFTLKHYESNKYLTAVPENKLTLRGNYKLIDILSYFCLTPILLFL